MSSYYARRREPLSYRLRLADDVGLTVFGLMLAVCGSIAVVVAVLMVGIIRAERVVGRTTCRNFSTQTGYPTKFVLLNFFDGGTCLAQAPNGRWVLNTKVLTFAGRKP